MTKRLVGILAMATAMLSVLATPAHALTKCTMKFRLEGWSAFYETSHGHGTISCDNGQSAGVAIETKGGGVTFGKSKIVNGNGTFSDVESISELFGKYANAGAHAGAGESRAAQAVTKGTVSLALTGEGEGVDLGFSFGKFTITKVARRVHRRHRSRG